MIFQTYLFILYFFNVPISRVTAPKKTGSIFSCCISNPKTGDSSPSEEQPHDLLDASLSSFSEWHKSQLQTIDEEETSSMEGKAVLPECSSSSRYKGQLQFDFEFSSSSRRDISESILIYEVCTNLIIDDVKKQFENFLNDRVSSTSTEKSSPRGEENTRIFSLVYHFMRDCLMREYNLEYNSEQLFKGTYVIYIAAEYYYSHILCTLWNKTTETGETEVDAMKLKRNNILQNCSSVVTMVRKITKAYKHVWRRIFNPDYGSQKSDYYEESSTSPRSESMSPEKRQITRTPSLRIDYEYNENTSTLNEAMSMLGSFIETMHEVYSKQKKKIKRQRHENIDENYLRSHIYQWINKKLLKYLKYFRQFFAPLNIEKGLLDFRANIQETYHKPFISLDEQFIWRNAVKVYQLNPDMNPFEFLSRCEELRNEVTYYTKGYINQILPIDAPREYRYPEYNLQSHENSFHVVIFPQ